jgi:methylmalonyl-CoA mutase
MTDDIQVSGEIKLEKEFCLADDFAMPTFDEWKASAEAALKGAPYEKKLVTRTYEGIDLQPIYGDQDSTNLPHLNQKPGFAGFSRGTHASGYLNKSWEISQEIPAATPDEFNFALKNDLQRGQTGITMMFDKASRKGLDSDGATETEVGIKGVAISSLEDFSRALDAIDLEKYPLHIIPGYSALEPLMLLNAYLQQQGIDPKKVSGSIDADPLAILAADGKLTESLETVYQRMAAATMYANQFMPGMKTVGVCGIPHHNAGADAVTELAYVLATAVQYIDQLSALGLDIDSIAGKMRFTFAIGPFYFMEIAKIRAARLLWSKIVESYKGSKESAKMTIHGRTSFYNQTVYDPYVNMLRTTTEAFSAIAAGVDSLSTNRFNETFAPGDEFSRRMARNTQIVLQDECRLDRLIDPAGGSYFVEKLTHQVTEKAWKLFQKIEAEGGMLEALKNGSPQAQISEVASKRKKDISKRKSIIVGTNFSANMKEEKPQDKIFDSKRNFQQRKETLQNYRAKNVANKKEIEEKISILVNSLIKGISDTEQGIEAGIIAFLAGATLGEFNVTQDIGTKFPAVAPLNLHRASQVFEQLRDAVELHKKRTDSNTGPKLFLANMGSVAQHKARADFSQSFFEIGGFDVINPQGGFDSPQSAIDAVLKSEAPVLVICSTDDTYPELVPPIVKGLKEKKPGIIVLLAGYPKDQIDQHKERGVDEFIYMGADAFLILSGILKKLGVLS